MGKRTLFFLSSLVLTVVLSLSVRAADKKDPSIASEYKRLEKQFEDARQEHVSAYQKANEEERKNLKYPDRRKHAQEMLALAEKEPASADSIDPLIAALQHARYDKSIAPRAMELLRTHHVENEKMARVCQMLAYTNDKEATAFLETALAKSPHNEVKGAAALAIGMHLTHKDPKQAEKHFNNVIEKLGTKEQKHSAKGELFEMHNLAIGKVAPEIQGEDVDGKQFKLSDYRGKVVVLDFWGDW